MTSFSTTYRRSLDQQPTARLIVSSLARDLDLGLKQPSPAVPIRLFRDELPGPDKRPGNLTRELSRLQDPNTISATLEVDVLTKLYLRLC